MKLPTFALIAVAAGALAATPALADRHVEVHRSTTTTTVTNGGPHANGPRHWRTHRVCRTHWYHHRKVRRCTQERY